MKPFTIEEARRALPLVKKIAEDLRRTMEQISAEPSGLSFIYGVITEDDLPLLRRETLVEQRERLQGFIRELTEIGVELKGLQPLLVDFPSIRNGENILLCWALGEDDIAHWHTIEGGFRGRQPL
jgi:hypothetical protein